MASSAQYVGTPQVWAGSMSTANTARDGTGTTTTLVTGAAAPGTRIDKIRFVGVGTVTGGMVRVFLNNGTSKFLLREVAVQATTPSATVEGWAYDLTFGDGLVLPSASWSVLVATNNAETFNAFAYGGNL
ncbi:hypothetical protein SAMN05444159_1249 [Bradyrhizobium lablabi]|uniref:Uncharacterized protein n=1 Tax=Bradyrhizobium lablabi TaxID=722472 RepID=A0A1M6LDR7_9BRAD|nr:hypothetical protein [Bradyrhizobium lablabi]SHJ69350.1 hypothetical protein SAMN05444159_1249 [Bradyrhizobium lablabi]